MRKKEVYSVFFIVLLMIFIPFTNFASANFVCGKVNPLGEISPAWLDVKVYYPEEPAKYTTCQVSPWENKFCCDPKEIKDVEWQVGKTIIARISEEDYATRIVKLNISGEGYDVFPEMQLLKKFNPSNVSATRNSTTIKYENPANDVQFPKKIPGLHYLLEKLSAKEHSKTYLKISRDKPLVMEIDNYYINQIAIFPKSDLEDVSAFIDKNPSLKMKKSRYNFVIGSDMDSRDVEKILIRLKIKKPSFFKHIKKMALFFYNTEKDSWDELKTTQYNEDENYFYYESYGKAEGNFAVEINYAWGDQDG